MTDADARPDAAAADTDEGPRRRVDGPLSRLTRARTLLRARPTLAFFLAAFAYSWGVFALLVAFVGVDTVTGARRWQVPFAWGPPLAAVLSVRLDGDAVLPWLRSLLDPRTATRWYVLAAATAVVYADLGSLLAGLAGVRLGLAAPPAELARSFLVTLLLAGSLEEVGWRGFAQGRLQARYGAGLAAVLVGVAWGVWHLPFVFLGGAGYDAGGIGAVVALTVFGVLMSVLLAWLFNGSGGTLPVVMLAHAILNAGPVLEPAGAVPGRVPGAGVGLLAWLGMIAILLVAYGHRRLAPRRPDPATAGTRRDGAVDEQ